MRKPEKYAERKRKMRKRQDQKESDGCTEKNVFDVTLNRKVGRPRAENRQNEKEEK